MMPPVIPPPQNIRAFKSESEFERWLAQHHDSATEIWIKIHKKNSGLPTVTYAEALDVALCWGWIDGIRKSFDAVSFLQRFSPRKPRSIWSKINTQHIERLRTAKRMQAAGEAQVTLAMNDGRWENAYSGARDITIPDDFTQAIAASPPAQAMFDVLTSQNRYALAFRLGNIKRAATRAKRIAEYVAMLARGETIYPNKSVAKQPATTAKKVATQPAKTGAKKAATQPTKEPAKQPAKNLAKTAARKPAKQPAKKTLNSATKSATRTSR